MAAGEARCERRKPFSAPVVTELARAFVDRRVIGAKAKASLTWLTLGQTQNQTRALKLGDARLGWSA